MTKLAMPFDNPTTYKNHSGIDFGKPINTPILASSSGIVTAVGWWNDRAGYATIIDYDDGPLVMYCHQPERAARPRVGARVAPSGYIGAVGNSGRSTGPHLHMEIMSGPGAHTDEGVWLYFDRNDWIGKPRPATTNSEPFNPDEIGDEVFIANVRGSWFLIVPNGGGKPSAVVLDGGSEAGKSGIPVIKFNTDSSINALNKAVQYV